jgi:hypothetical protein
MEAIISKVNSKMGGQAEAAIQGLGSLTLLKNAVGELQESFGERLQPVIVTVSQKLIEVANGLQDNSKFMDGLAQTIELTTKFAVIMSTVFQNLGTVLGGGASTAVDAFSNLLMGRVGKAFKVVLEGNKHLATDLTDQWTKLNASLEAVDAAFLARKQENTKSQQDMAKASAERDAEIQAEAQALKDETFTIKSEEELVKIATHEQLKTEEANTGNMARLNAQIVAAKTSEEILKAHTDKKKFLEEQYDKTRRSQLTAMQQFEQTINSQKVRDTQGTLGQISSLQSSSNVTLFRLGQAAAIADATISTAQGVAKAWSLGPFLGPVLAGLVATAGGVQIAKIASASIPQLADGGIVKAQPGGMQATIGEGGSDEAVIPLDGSAGMLGNKITIVVNGGMLGDQQSARELAVALDRELLKLRQSNQSLAFDEGVI